MPVWFHGSPLELNVLAAGSTITRRRDVARIFSHKPTIVSFDDSGKLFHNGSVNGRLYEVVDVEPEDVRPHPTSTMAESVEWLTNRDLRLRFIESTSPKLAELLTDDEVARLRQQALDR